MPDSGRWKRSAFRPPESARQGYHKLVNTTLPSSMTRFYNYTLFHIQSVSLGTISFYIHPPWPHIILNIGWWCSNPEQRLYNHYSLYLFVLSFLCYPLRFIILFCCRPTPPPPPVSLPLSPLKISQVQSPPDPTTDLPLVLPSANPSPGTGPG